MPNKPVSVIEQPEDTQSDQYPIPSGSKLYNFQSWGPSP